MQSILRFSGVLVFAVALLTVNLGIVAQNAAEEGDPPITALISISSPDDNGLVTISGAAGAVFPAARVSIRNLYTGDLVVVNAGITGSFSAQIYGPYNTPFWISPASDIPNALRDQNGSLPGGPGTIIYGSPPESRSASTAITQIILDGQLDDWGDDFSITETISAQRNQNSLYVAYREPVPQGAIVAIVLVTERETYELAFNPIDPTSATLQQIAPTLREPVPVALAIEANDAGDIFEARISLTGITLTPETPLTMDRFIVRTDGEEELSVEIMEASIAYVDEQDGIVYAGGKMDGNLTRFSANGLSTVAGLETIAPTVRWDARGRVDTLNLDAGDDLTLEFDITLNVEDLPQPAPRIAPTGIVSLQPVAIDTDDDGIAEQNIVAENTNNGWSNVFTASGLALDNLTGDFTQSAMTVNPSDVIRQDEQLLFGMRFETTLRSDLPAGLYVPTFRLRDGEETRLPIVINVGGITETHLPFTLLYDQPSDGSRGIISDADSDLFALSNRVRFNSETYILPPGNYPLEPYLPNLMPNTYSTSTAPLLPLLFPGGRLNVTVTRPDGDVDELPSAAIVQNRLSTAEIDERERFGAQSPLDVYRLTTLNDELSAYNFDAYGEYTISLNGTVEDLWGNRYAGGGDYHVMIAEPFDLTAGTLPGTPFISGDAVYAGLTLSPQLPAEVTVTAQFYPVDGSAMIETEFSGFASTNGYFNPSEALIFDSAGEYLLQYEARFVADDGRIWAGSMTTAGVVGDPATRLVAHGQRGLATYSVDPQTWFTTASYPYEDGVNVAPIVNSPYQSGDVIALADNAQNGVNPVIAVQDLGGRYSDWLIGTLGGGYQGTLFSRLAAEGRLPLIPVLGGVETPYTAALLPEFVVNQAYGYVSAVRPDVTVRQFVQGIADGDLPLYWDNDDPLNQQIGAGIDGQLPGDYTFIFGGAVIRNAEAGLQDTAIYAALAVVEDDDAIARVFPPYRGSAGGPDGGALLTINGNEINAFFVPTSFRAGQVMQMGETVSLAGQVAPTLTSRLSATITAPDGTRTTINGLTNPIGYFYDPEQDFSADQTGIWTIDLNVTPIGESSAGLPEDTALSGGVVGIDARYSFYVVEAESDPLTWELNGDVEIFRNALAPVNFILSVPDDWTESTAEVTVTTAGYILAQEAIIVRDGSISYQYNQTALARTFTTLETSGNGTDLFGSDVVTVTFVANGVDAGGQSATRTRSVTIFHDRLISFETQLTPSASEGESE
ncbi:MAG: hypothetical protein RIC84_20765 [Aggregatilineales bacterium]